MISYFFALSSYRQRIGVPSLFLRLRYHLGTHFKFPFLLSGRYNVGDIRRLVSHIVAPLCVVSRLSLHWPAQITAKVSSPSAHVYTSALWRTYCNLVCVRTAYVHVRSPIEAPPFPRICSCAHQPSNRIAVSFGLTIVRLQIR